jgi:hypothetical protein
MNYCKKCYDINCGTTYKCQPFRCGNKEFSGEDRTTWREYYARDHEAAAKQWAKYYDQGSYPLLDGETVECEVIAADDTVKKFDVYGRIEHVYYAEEMEEIENIT